MNLTQTNYKYSYEEMETGFFLYEQLKNIYNKSTIFDVVKDKCFESEAEAGNLTDMRINPRRSSHTQTRQSKYSKSKKGIETRRKYRKTEQSKLSRREQSKRYREKKKAELQIFIDLISNSDL